MTDLQGRLVEMVDQMPAFSGSVVKILKMTSDINCAPKDLVEVIDHDPVLTIKILKLVNSAYFGLSRKIVSIQHGVVFVGINTIKNLALTIATIGMLPKEPLAGLDMDDFLLHSLGTAAISRQLSERLNVSSRESTDYFVGGLLHDIGKVVFAQYISDEMARALERAEQGEGSLFQMELEEIGANHAQVGGMLAVKWQLPEPLVVAIREHHCLESTGDLAQMRDCVIAANLIAKRFRFGNGGNPRVEGLPGPVKERFGMDLDELHESLENLGEELEKTRAFAYV